MKAAMLWLLIAASGPAQCPPGATGCPAPSRAARPLYGFDARSGNPAPWSTVVRISATSPGSRSIGSGVVVASSAEGESLALTCAHLLRGRGTLAVETFGAGVDHRTGSVGRPTASYPAEAGGRDDAADVGMVRFRASRELPRSPLAPEGLRLAPGQALCSVGCSLGADPTAFSERYRGPVALDTEFGRYRGIACEYPPAEGRSGGGLFDDRGRLLAVCDFASPEGGFYADTAALRAMLGKHAPADSAPPAPRPGPIAPPRDEPPAIVAAPKPGGWEVAGPIAALGLPTVAGLWLGLVAWLKKLGRPSPSPGPAAAGPAPLPRPEELIPVLLASIRAADEDAAARAAAEATAKANREVLDRLRGLIDPKKP